MSVAAMSVAGMCVAASSMLDRVVGNCCGSMGVPCSIVSLEIILSAPCLDAKAGAPEDTVAVDCIGPCSRLEACGPSNVCVCNRWKLFTVSATVQFQEAAMIELRRAPYVAVGQHVYPCYGPMSQLWLGYGPMSQLWLIDSHPAVRSGIFHRRVLTNLRLHVQNCCEAYG